MCGYNRVGIFVMLLLLFFVFPVEASTKIVHDARYNEILVNFNCEVIKPPFNKGAIAIDDFNQQYVDIINYLKKHKITKITKLYPKRTYGDVNIINRRGKAVTLPEMSQLIQITLDNTRYARSDVNRIISELDQMDEVQYASEYGTLVPDYDPDDLLENLQWYINRLDMHAAWDISKGDDIKIAIIDTGVYDDHRDFEVYPGYSKITGGEGGRDDGHGTAVAGVAGAATQNYFDIASIGFNAKIVPYNGENETGYIADITSAVEDDRVDVINMSWHAENQYGEPWNPPALEAILENAYENGIVLVAAAGNEAYGDLEVPYNQWPAMYSNVIAVSAVDSDDDFITGFNCGSFIDVAAGGKDILTLGDQGVSDTVWTGGTSLATPMVSGIAALILAYNPEFSPEEVKNYIINSAEKVGQYSYTNGRNNYLGYGRVNAYGALVLARGWGNIDYHQVWTKDMKIVGKKAGDPGGLMDSLSVAVNDTLTILPNVTITWVKNQSYWHKLLVRGTLIAVADEDHPILFQTTADGQSLDNAWGGITILKSASNVQYCKIENSTFGLLFGTGISPTIERNKMYKCAYGLYYGTNATGAPKYNRMDHCTIGSRAISGYVVYERNDFINSSWYGLQFQSAAAPRLKRNIIETNPKGIKNESSSIVWMDDYTSGMGHNSVTGNTYDVYNSGSNVFAEYNWWGQDQSASYYGDANKFYDDYPLASRPSPVGSDLPGNFRILPHKRGVNDLIATGAISTVEEFLANIASLMMNGTERLAIAAYCAEVADYHSGNEAIFNAAREMRLVFGHDSHNQREIIAGYNDLLEGNLSDEMRSRVLLRVGETYLIELTDMENAMPYFGTLFKEYPDNENTMLAYLDIGQSEKAHAIYARLNPIEAAEHESETSVVQNFPNPFNPETTIRFSLSEEARTELKIYNIQGRLVKTLIDRKLPAGAHRVIWDGRDDRGGTLPTGVYFLRFSAGPVTQTRKMVLVK